MLVGWYNYYEQREVQLLSLESMASTSVHSVSVIALASKPAKLRQSKRTLSYAATFDYLHRLPALTLSCPACAGGNHHLTT